MFFLLALIGVPVVYLVVLARLALIKRDPRGIGLSLLFFAVAASSGIWAITQSRSSTAGIGFLGIPFMAALGGFLGLAFGRYRSSPEPAQRVGAWVALVAGLVLISFNIGGGAQTRKKNAVRDDQQARHSAEIARDRELIDSTLKENPGRQRAWLDSSIRTRMTDRAFLLAALPHDSISPELLDTLANSSDLGIALETVRNPGTKSETLERVYRSKTYPDYFFQALAAHRNTPAPILREIYRRPRTIGGLDIWFAGNSSTPHEILDEIARTNTDRSVLGALLENPAITCPILTQVAVNLMKGQNRDAEDSNVMRLNELLPSKCPNTTR